MERIPLASVRGDLRVRKNPLPCTAEAAPEAALAAPSAASDYPRPACLRALVPKTSYKVAALVASSGGDDLDLLIIEDTG